MIAEMRTESPGAPETTPKVLDPGESAARTGALVDHDDGPTVDGDKSAAIDASDPFYRGRSRAVWKLYAEVGEELGGNDRCFLSKAWALDAPAWQALAVALLRARALKLERSLSWTLKTLQALGGAVKEGGDADG